MKYYKLIKLLYSVLNVFDHDELLKDFLENFTKTTYVCHYNIKAVKCLSIFQILTLLSILFQSI